MAEIGLTDAAARRLNKLTAEDPTVTGLRLAVAGGGCSGFQYEMELAAGPGAEDLVIERDGAKLFIDPLSIPLLAGSQIDWVDELIGASFKVKNPNAVSSCGCGVSFSV